MSTVLTPLSELLLNTPLPEVSIQAELDETPVLVHVEPGGKVTWSMSSALFAQFTIVFTGPSPVAAGHRLTGNNDQPVVIHLSKKEHVYPYNIVYSNPDGTEVPTGAFAVRSCQVCGA